MINEQPKKESALLLISQLRTFEGHPYKVLDNKEMDSLVENIRERGICGTARKTRVNGKQNASRAAIWQ